MRSGIGDRRHVGVRHVTIAGHQHADGAEQQQANRDELEQHRLVIADHRERIAEIAQPFPV